MRSFLVNLRYFLVILSLLKLSSCKTHRFRFKAEWVKADPDGLGERRMIGFNGEWPIPDIHVDKGDRVELYLTNGFGDGTKTSLHFHGIFFNSSYGNMNQMDGPDMITQCPLGDGDTYFYNFTVPDQVGTYWYHAHAGSQYGDGMRAAFIIHDPDEPFEYDEDWVIGLADLYTEPSYKISKGFLSRYNPTGAEPIPRNILFNNTVNATLHFEPGKTYLMRFINQGLFVSQYISLEDHSMTVVEVDGVYVKPEETTLLTIASGQRMSVIVHAKDGDPKRNYALMQISDASMLDVIPPDLQLNRTIQISYDSKYPAAKEFFIESYSNAVNDFYLQPLQEEGIMEDYDLQVKLDLRMKTLGDGVKYAFFNNVTYTAPKIPTLTTLLTSGRLATDPRIYGDNINSVILKGGEIVEVVINNYDPGRHPFHLHGHNFQIVQKSPAFHENETFTDAEQDRITVPYNEDSPIMPFPVHPMLRDTVVLEPNGHVVIRFRADNPGVWFFHCHINWHVEQGLAAVFIEDPLTLQARETLTDNYKDTCSNVGMVTTGNAAGNSEDWLDLTGLPRQPKPLPEGFTIKGYIAFAISTLIGIGGLYSITKYGLQESIPNDAEVYDNLKKLLAKNNIET
ncbi:hypothetical protein Kpol_1058p12 [Vanderwaltozyma polyspora DSM 70294]|uniref:Iron transport multicopper oxidase FET5 n=1 Tax=Vanderwaltozyma polyspora (strain ATCC 22028 / DSM 70294 / BCRC 21397 / CBS 2163 / NBRC 10782 / NRRL Y-8283 / UCD 57-17) TaxID=436907 RepID=A7TJP6_VANPO|nr:uncharacterized protein Kpol_1058p12 [Vanderwaltozyma polyspora DSM 70294]EDO17475.1 hypothetical protein Kpol_1058p12 [Vanderwaltozyma polyspora DSM 70294]